MDFKRNASSGRVRRLLVLLSRNLYVCIPIEKRPTKEMVLLEARRVAGTNNAEDKVYHILHGAVLSIKSCVGQPFLLAWRTK